MSNTTDKQVKHTAGPWYVHLAGTSNPGDLIIKHVDKDGLLSHVCRLYETALCEEHGTTMANAALIAAAPELLEACRYARESFYAIMTDAEAMGMPPLVLQKLDAAIAKAEGGLK